ARFDLVETQKDFQVADFLGAMPIDLRMRKWSFRLFPHHISSHLGDDYIKRTGHVPEDKFYMDSLKWLAAYEPWDRLRVYAGMQYVMRMSHSELGKHVVQTGAEWKSRWYKEDHLQLYGATDFQSWERTGWNPQINIQMGVHVVRTPQDKQSLS